MSPPAPQRAERTPTIERGTAPRDTARTAQRAVPTLDSVKMRPPQQAGIIEVAESAPELHAGVTLRVQGSREELNAHEF